MVIITATTPVVTTPLSLPPLYNYHYYYCCHHPLLSWWQWQESGDGNSGRGVVPTPCFSHLVSILQFSKRLVRLHPNFHVTCMIPTLGSPSSASKSILEILSSNINFIFLQPVKPEDLSQGATIETQILFTVTRPLPSIH
ncbi:Hydroquinone glucosyltransferase, partial [Mucuna pruriens]